MEFSSISTLSSSSTSSLSDLNEAACVNSQTSTSTRRRSNMITKSYTTTSSSSSSSSSSNSSLLKALAGSPSPRSVTSMFFYDSLSDDEPRHFLDSCYLCNKALSGHRDIFMYGGDMPFCSEDCRQKKIDFDEKEEKEKEKEIKKKKSFSSSIKSFQSSYLTGKTAQESFWR